MLRPVHLGLAFLALAPNTQAQASSPATSIAAEACFGCHGPAGQGVTGGAAIAGMDRAELSATLIAFRSNERPGTIMGRIARGYNDAEIAAISDYIARQR
jgi:sulfide dehydrogenase cytochrome subunit